MYETAIFLLGCFIGVILTLVYGAVVLYKKERKKTVQPERGREVCRDKLFIAEADGYCKCGGYHPIYYKPNKTKIHAPPNTTGRVQI